METITGFVDHIVFQNSENGYTVMILSTEGEEMTCVGMCKGLTQGENISAEGEYIEHPVYGRQFKIQSYETVTPTDRVGMERYLGSGAIRGVGEALAARIVKKFGDDTFRIIEEEPERLAEVKGISERKAQEIAIQMEEKKDLREALVYLQQYGISNTLAVKIYNTYGMEMYSVMRENPYRLAEDVSGVGFRIADEIAGKIGIHTDSDYRIRSGILYTLLQAVGEGHCYLPLDLLLRRASELLGVSEENIRPQVDNLIMDRKLVAKGEAVFASSYYYAELNCANMLRNLNIPMVEAENLPSQDAAIRKRLERMAENLSMELDELQLKAVEESIKNGLFILSGGPGTGKTTTINMIIRFFESEGMDIFLAAPTGRAAKRMTEATGFEAKTIHRLLELNSALSEDDTRKANFERNQENPLEADVVIIDEMSMVDISLMHSLLKAVNVGTRLILVGDVNQLPSVGAGNVFYELIHSGMVPVTVLDWIFRQSKDGLIAYNAKFINEGSTKLYYGNDFVFVDSPTQIESAKRIQDIYCKEAAERGIENVQILSPFREKGEAASEQLNRAIRERVNPFRSAEEEVKIGNRTFRVHDRIMQTKNTEKVSNGDLGFITGITTSSKGERLVQMDFGGDRKLTYTPEQLAHVDLAYATTIHKAMGSEFETVIIPIVKAHTIMLYRNLLYTAVTRAKKKVILVGHKPILFMAVHRADISKRNTMLGERIRLYCKAYHTERNVLPELQQAG